MKKQALIILILATFFVAVSCTKDNDEKKGTSFLTIRLTDAPATYDAVNIDIKRISVKVDSNWHEFELASPGIYDLISLSNGNSALLISAVAVPSGEITQMRLHLGDSNTIIVDSVIHDLKTPSGQSSGYKVKINAQIEPGILYSVLLDFDAEKSVVQQGNGGYLLKPVVYGNLIQNIGQIDGMVFPSTGATLASAWNSADTFNVFIDPTNGFFLINSLVPGSYTVKISSVTPYLDTTILNIPVTAGNVTHLDSIQLSQ